MTQQSALKITVEKPTESKLRELDVKNWPIWMKEVSVFDWSYDEKEVCYFLEGEVTVTTSQGDVSFGQGDLVTFRKFNASGVLKKAVKSTIGSDETNSGMELNAETNLILEGRCHALPVPKTNAMLICDYVITERGLIKEPDQGLRISVPRRFPAPISRCQST